MLAIKYSLLSFSGKLTGKNVLWHTDNKNCVHIVNKGSVKDNLQVIALDIHSLCVKHSISLNIQWVKRDLNKLADEYSKMVDVDDYSVSDEFFELLNSMYGPHTIDRFANDYNTKLRRFNSLYWTPTSESDDAFSQDWSSDNNWLVPPVVMIPRAINHLIECHGQGTLVAPYWPSSPFYPLIFGQNSIPKHFIKDILLFKPPQRIYIQGKNKNSIFGTERFASKVLVLRLACKSNVEGEITAQ